MIRRIWDVTLTVSNLQRAVEFYERVLGLQKKYEFPDYAGFECGGIEFGLRTWGGLQSPRMGEPYIDLLVDDIQESFATLSARGVEFAKPPQETAWGGQMAAFTDPDGNALRLVQVHWEKYFSACAPK